MTQHPHNIIQCPECKREFTSSIGKATHMRRSHLLNADGTSYTGPDTQAVKAKAIVKSHPNPKKKRARYGRIEPETGTNFQTVPTELYSYITVHLESIIHRVAFEHDYPERKLTQGFIEFLRRP